MSKYKNMNLANKTLTVMVDREGVHYTPQAALLQALEENVEVYKDCIRYIDRKRDEVRNETTN
jgi:hypothetical protein